MTSLLPTLVTSELLRGSPYPGSAPYRLPTQVTSIDPLYKTSPDTSSTPGLLLSEYLNVMPNNFPPGTCIALTSFLYEAPNGSHHIYVTQFDIFSTSPTHHLHTH